MFWLTGAKRRDGSTCGNRRCFIGAHFDLRAGDLVFELEIYTRYVCIHEHHAEYRVLLLKLLSTHVRIKLVSHRIIYYCCSTGYQVELYLSGLVLDIGNPYMLGNMHNTEVSHSMVRPTCDGVGYLQSLMCIIANLSGESVEKLAITARATIL